MDFLHRTSLDYNRVVNKKITRQRRSVLSSKRYGLCVARNGDERSGKGQTLSRERVEDLVNKTKCLTSQQAEILVLILVHSRNLNDIKTGNCVYIRINLERCWGIPSIIGRGQSISVRPLRFSPITKTSSRESDTFSLSRHTLTSRTLGPLRT